MAFKSKAQRERCAELVKLGSLTQKDYDEMNEGTPDDIPDRVTSKKQSIIRRPRGVRGVAK